MSRLFTIMPRLIADDLAPMMRMTEELLRYPAFTSSFMHPSSRLGESEVHNTDKEFKIRMELQHFKPEEIKITSDNSRLTVSAKHEEKQDNQGFVAREVTRIYKLPEDVDLKSVTSTMTDSGVLNIKLQKNAIEAPKETPIPVTFKQD